MIFCLVLFTSLYVLMNDIVMLHLLELVMDYIWRNMHDYDYEEYL
jgi:hypothetical protein